MVLEPCLSVSTGRTRYQVKNNKYEEIVKFMGLMGSEVIDLMGYLDFLLNDKIAAGGIWGDYTFRGAVA